MQLTVHLRVDAESFFKVLRQSIVADIERARGKKAKASNVHAGYSYKRYLKDKRDEDHAAQVRITEWRPPVAYCCTVSNQGGITTISYTVAPGEEDGIDVTYTEEFEGSSTSQNVFSKAVAAVKTLPAKSRIKEQLHAIEGQILADQYEVEDGSAS